LKKLEGTNMGRITVTCIHCGKELRSEYVETTGKVLPVAEIREHGKRAQNCKCGGKRK
jgi:hypothetical protein